MKYTNKTAERNPDNPKIKKILIQTKSVEILNSIL